MAIKLVNSISSCISICSVRAVLCFAAIVTFSAACLCAEEVEPLALGQTAPSFALPGVDGKTHRLDDYKDAKALMVIFTCNHCPTAQAYEGRIKKLYEDFHGRGVAIIAISPNDAQAVRLDELGYTDLGDSLDDMKQRAKDEDFKFPYLYDGETQKTSRQFGVLATPHVFIFGEQRRLQYAGRIDDNELAEPKREDAREALEEILAGKPVSVPQTRVFGCSTKWADKRESAKAAVKRWNQETAELVVVKPNELREKLTAKSDKYRLVNVWATWCVPCVEELDELVTMHRMYRKRPFELITISADGLRAKDAAAKLLNEKHCSATNYILDGESRDDLFDSVDPKWKGAVPYTLLIAPDGKVVHRIHGELEPRKLRREIVRHLGRTYASKAK
ncbi:MAG: hypothetical protein Aurels2KO_26100 [Aureliella sp.]